MASRLKTLSEKSWRWRKRALGAVRPQPGVKSVALLAGVHRSGTNSMLGMLDQSLETTIFREGDARAFDDYMMRDEATIRGLIAASKTPLVVVKALHEADRLTDLMEAFQPEGGKVFALWPFRNWRDVVNSLVRRWPTARNAIDEIVAGTGVGEWRGLGVTDATREKIASVYRPDINNETANALFWLIRNELFFDQALEKAGNVRLLNYDAMAPDPPSEIAPLCAFLGLTMTPRMAGAIHAKSLGRDAPPDVEPAAAILCDAMHERLLAAWRAQKG